MRHDSLLKQSIYLETEISRGYPFIYNYKYEKSGRSQKGWRTLEESGPPNQLCKAHISSQK